MLHLYLCISEKAVCAHDIPLSYRSARLKCTQREREDVYVYLHVKFTSESPKLLKLLLWKSICRHMRATMVCKRDVITVRNETASPLVSFLRPFFSHYIYVAISGSSIGLPRMSEDRRKKNKPYICVIRV